MTCYKRNFWSTQTSWLFTKFIPTRGKLTELTLYRLQKCGPKISKFDHDHEILFINETSQEILLNFDEGLFSKSWPTKNSIEASDTNPHDYSIIIPRWKKRQVEVLDTARYSERHSTQCIRPSLHTKEKKNPRGLTMILAWPGCLFVKNHIWSRWDINFESVPNKTTSVTIPWTYKVNNNDKTWVSNQNLINRCRLKACNLFEVHTILIYLFYLPFRILCFIFSYNITQNHKYHNVIHELTEQNNLKNILNFSKLWNARVYNQKMKQKIQFEKKLWFQVGNKDLSEK